MGLLVFLILLNNKFPIIMYLGLALRLPIIFMGMLTYLYIRENKPRLLLFYVSVLIIIYFVPRHFVMVSSVAIPLLLYGLGESDFKFPFSSIISFLGKHSLDIYLGQNIAIETMMRRGFFDSMTNKLSIRVIAVLLLGAMLACVFYGVQKYFWKLFVRNT